MRIPGAGGPHGFGAGTAARLVGVEFAATLEAYGWSDRWSDLLAAHPGSRVGRVVRHDGSAVQLATTDGIFILTLTRRLDPAPTVGDWMAFEGTDPVAVLPAPRCSSEPVGTAISRWRRTSTSCCSSAGSTDR